MAEEGVEVQRIDWRRCCEFLEVLRSFRMAAHPLNLLLCFLGLAASFWLAVLVDQLPAPVGQTAERVYGASFYQHLHRIATTTLWGDWALPYLGGKTWDDFLVFLMAPVRAVREVITLAVAYWERTPWFALINTVLSLGIWALVGGAVTRMAAVRVAREESLPWKQALCFAGRKWPSTVASPLIPFGVLVFLALLMGAMTGLPLMIPYVGEWAVGLLLFLPLLMGVVLALIFVGGAFSVGLQWPTIAAEGSDSFDAISRSISYISSRPWKYLLTTVFSVIYGCATFIFVKFVAFLTLRITHEAIATFSWGQGDLTDKIARLWAEPTLASPWPQAGLDQFWSEPTAHYLFLFWAWVILGVTVAFLPSFFFCSQTVIYFLMRRSVDSTDIEEVYLEEGEAEELPVDVSTETGAGSETGTEAAPPAEGETAPPPPKEGEAQAPAEGEPSAEAPEKPAQEAALETEASAQPAADEKAGKDEPVRLSSFRGKKPVCLIFSSYT